jgi:excisionase family DNA binding protein
MRVCAVYGFGMSEPPDTPDAPRKWLKVPEAASYLDIHQERVRALIRRGDIRATRTGDGERAPYRTTEAWLDDWLIRRAQGGRPVAAFKEDPTDTGTPPAKSRRARASSAA